MPVRLLAVWCDERWRAAPDVRSYHMFQHTSKYGVHIMLSYTWYTRSHPYTVNQVLGEHNKTKNKKNRVQCTRIIYFQVQYTWYQVLFLPYNIR